MRIEKLVLEEQKAQAQKALQEARKENEILRGRLDASEMSLSKLTQKAISPITPSSSSSIGSALHQQQQVSDDVLRRGSLLSNELGGYSLTELDDLEEYCHKALKRIGIAKVRLSIFPSSSLFCMYANLLLLLPPHIIARAILYANRKVEAREGAITGAAAVRCVSRQGHQDRDYPLWTPGLLSRVRCTAQEMPNLPQ